jgi:hypothetical protein
MSIVKRVTHVSHARLWLSMYRSLVMNPQGEKGLGGRDFMGGWKYWICVRAREMGCQVFIGFNLPML